MAVVKMGNFRGVCPIFKPGGKFDRDLGVFLALCNRTVWLVT